MADDAAVPRKLTVKTWVFGAYLVVLILLLLTVLIHAFPGHLDDLKQPSASVDLLGNGWFVFAVSPEIRLLILVIVAGALGSYVHLATSFTDYVGNRQLKESWFWWYVLRPFIGVALAVIVYFTVRAGLISGGAGAEDMSPYGVAAVGALAGMFARQAGDKLREVFKSLFALRQPAQRADALTAAGKDAAKP